MTAVMEDYFRALYRRIHATLAARIVANESTVAQLATLGLAHLALPDNAAGVRLLLLGPSGSGKSLALDALREALIDALPAPPAGAAGPALPGVPWARVDACELTSPGWSGAVSINELVTTTLSAGNWTQFQLARLVVVIDEVHQVRVAPDATGPSRIHRAETLSSLLALVGGGTLQLFGERPRTWNAARSMVILAGSFHDLDLTPRTATPAHLAALGYPYELASRMAGSIVLEMQPPSRSAVAQILAAWPQLESYRGLATACGWSLEVSPQAIALMAEDVASGHATLRSAGAALAAAAVTRLSTALTTDADERGPIHITPDDLERARSPVSP